MNKLYNNMRVFLLASCVSFFTSCDNALDRNEASNPDKVLSFMISKGNMKTSRASMNDATMRTEFEVGDKAGVFAVHDGHIVDGFNNLELTYNASGKWQPNESILYNTDMENYTFYAYYPYNTDILFNSTNENPFEDAIRNRKFISDQSSVKLFNEADLMTTSGCSLDPEFHIVNFTMTHVGRLVTIQLPNSSYIFENENPTIEPYVLSKAENVIFSVNGSKVYPYFDEQVQAYRLILGDNQTKMVVEYINNGRFQKVEITNLPEIERGEYATYIVDGGVQSQKMFLQIGDYYLSDGNIISKDSQLTEEEKMKIIGIIYKLKTTNTIMETNPNWKHAMVIGLTEINNSQWEVRIHLAVIGINHMDLMIWDRQMQVVLSSMPFLLLAMKGQWPGRVYMQISVTFHQNFIIYTLLNKTMFPPQQCQPHGLFPQYVNGWIFKIQIMPFQ